MDDKTPTPDQTPAPDQTPQSTPDAETVPVTPPPTPGAEAPIAGSGQHPVFPAAEPVPAPATSASKPGRTRALLIGGGIAAAVVLAGGGVAVGAAIGDEFGDDDRSSMSDDGPRHDADDHGPRGEDRGDDDRGDDDHGNAPSHGRGPVTGIGTASADELIAIADAARRAADGEVTSIDAKRDGTWEVQLTTAAGAETEVRVDEALVASVTSTDAADGDDTGPRSPSTTRRSAPWSPPHSPRAEGMITDLDVDGDDVSPYDASVLTSDNRSIDIDFSADFAVVGTDID